MKTVEQKRNWQTGFLTKKRWWLFCGMIVLLKLTLFAVDPTAKFVAGESLRYLFGAINGAVPEDLPYFYGHVVRWFCNSAQSLTALIFLQVLLSAAMALMVAWICRAFFLLSEWLSYLFGFVCSVDPLQLASERCVTADTFSLFFYALVLHQSFVYLRNRRIATLLIIQVMSVIAMGFRMTLLLPLLIMAAALPSIAFGFRTMLRAALANSHASGSRFYRHAPFWRHFAISLIAVVLLHWSYREANGFLSHDRPAYSYETGSRLLSAWAPALRPEDSPDPRLADIIGRGEELHLENHALRRAQRFAPDHLVERWRQVESDKRRSEEIARRTALNALRRDPGGVLKAVAMTYYAFWKGPAMERLAISDLGVAKPNEGQQKVLLARYNWRAPADTGGTGFGFLGRYYVAASPYYFTILLSPLLGFVLLFTARQKAHAVLLLVHTWLLFGATFLFALSPAPRLLQPLSILTLLTIALAVKSLYAAPVTKSGEAPATSARLDINRQRRLCVGISVIAIAAILRIGLAGNQPLWTDEVFTLAMATGHSLEHAPTVANPALGDFVQLDRPQSAEELRHYMRHDNPPAGLARVVRTLLISDTHPPLYYFLVYGWTLMFGTSDFALRAFSIICSLACFPILGGIAWRVCGRKGVVPSCLLFAFSPLAISYSTEGRMYSLLWFWLLAVIWVSLVLTKRSRDILLAAGWIGASAAGFLTHYFFVFPWAALVGFLLARPGKLARSRLVTCIVLTALVILPWYVKVPETLHAWRVMKDWIKVQPLGFDRLTAALQLVLQNFSGAGHHSSSNFVALVIFAIIGTAAWLRLRLQMFWGRRLLLWLLFAAACTGPLLFDLVMHTYTVSIPRYAMAALPVACLLAAEALTWVSYPTRLLLIVLILLAWAPNSLIDYRTGARLSPRHRAEMVSAKETPTDLLIINAAGGGVLSIVRYLNGPAPIVTWLPPWVPQPTRRIPESIREFAAGRTRILWLAAAGSPDVTPERDWLRANTLVFEETKIFSDFRPKGSPTF